MARKHKPEEIIGKLREAEIVLAQAGMSRRRSYWSDDVCYVGRTGTAGFGTRSANCRH